MKVFVNLPQTQKGREELANGVAKFHATLMLEKIKKLRITDSSKEKVLNFILKDLEEAAKKECMSD